MASQKWTNRRGWLPRIHVFKVGKGFSACYFNFYSGRVLSNISTLYVHNADHPVSTIYSPRKEENVGGLLSIEIMTKVLRRYSDDDTKRYILAEAKTDEWQPIPTLSNIASREEIEPVLVPDTPIGNFGGVLHRTTKAGQDFAAWIRARDINSSIFYISGDSGTGKTYLMKHILRQVRSSPSLLYDGTPSWTLTPVVISHFFSGQPTRSGQPEDEFDDMHRNLLLQLFKQVPSEVGKSFILTSMTKYPLLEDVYSRRCLLKETLEESLRVIQETQTVYVFLDGSIDGEELCESTCLWLNFPRVKVCIASRPDVESKFWEAFDSNCCDPEAVEKLSKFKLEMPQQLLPRSDTLMENIAGWFGS